MHRVLYVDAAPFPGGAQQSLQTLIAALDPSEFTAYTVGPALLQEFVPPGQYIPLPLPSLYGTSLPQFLWTSLAAAVQLRTVISGVRPDLVHVNGRAAWPAAWLAARVTRTPLVWHARDLVGPLRFDVLATALSDLCLVPSHAVSKRVRGCDLGRWRAISAPLLKWRRPDPVVIPNGVDTVRFRPGDRLAARTALGLPPHRVIAGMIGQWAPWKRVDRFLEAARQAHRQDPAFYALLVGGPPPGGDATLAQTYRERLGEAGTVMEWQSDVPTVMAALDILAHPAAGEAFGRVAVEAMACGVPVVGVRAGGLRETIVDGVTGILVPPDDAAALCAAMLRLARRPSLAEQMGQEGRLRVLHHYDAGRHAVRVQEQYRLLLDRLHANRH